MKDLRISVCFILDHNLMSYRIPLFECLSESGISVTVCHTGSPKLKGSGIKEIILRSRSLFKFEYRILPPLKKYDIVVHMQNLRILNFWILSLWPFRKYKLVHWGIGTSSAKGLSLNRNIISQVRNFLASCASAQVLYSDYPISLFSKRVKEKTFIANNTIYNPYFSDFSNEKKDSYLFIGSLNKRKGIDILIRAFSIVNRQSSKRLKLRIIGDGSEKGKLQTLVEELNDGESIEFLGAINNDIIKQKYFARAIASVSPKQAGLSVLESFSYGVPFVAYENAISGGELYNIINNETGYLVNSENELVSVLTKLDENRSLSQKLGHNSFEYYKNKRQMKFMVDSFLKSFWYVIH